jgi:hypothetical protein
MPSRVIAQSLIRDRLTRQVCTCPVAVVWACKGKNFSHSLGWQTCRELAKAHSCPAERQHVRCFWSGAPAYCGSDGTRYRFRLIYSDTMSSLNQGKT